MGKAIFQLLAVVLIFFTVWFSLSRVDYVRTFHLRGISKRTENKIGDFIMHTLEKSDGKIQNDSAQAILDKIEKRLRSGSPQDPGIIHVHLIHSNEVNAFALPGNNLVVYTGLINRCDSVSELSGVMAHELGHIALNHVMKRLGSEIGISVLAAMVANGNSQAASKIIRTLSSSAFERSQESDADAFAVSCLQRAHINAEGFANFMGKIAEIHADVPEEMEWISSHPDSRKRVQAIRASFNGQHDFRPVLTDEEWTALKQVALSAAN